MTRRNLAFLTGQLGELVRGGSVAFSVKVFGAIAGFSFNVAIARILGPEATGIYFLGLALVMVFSMAGRLGLDNVLLKLVASDAAVGNWSGIGSAYRTGLLLSLVTSATLATLLFYFAPIIASGLFSEPGLEVPLRLFALAVVPFSLLTLHAECLKGLKRIFHSQLVQGALLPFLALLGLLIVGDRYGVEGAVLAYVSAATITLVVAWAIWRTVSQPSIRSRTYSRSHLLVTSLPLLWVGLMNLAMGWTASFVLGVAGTSAEVGIYNVASRTALLIGFILVAVNSIAAPQFAGLYRENRLKELRRAVVGASRLVLLLSVPAGAAMMLFPATIIGVFGSGFVETGAIVLVVLAAGQLINVATGSVTYLLMMTGLERMVARSVTVAAVANVVLTIILVPSFGALGAAMAAAVSLAAQNGLAVYYAWTELRIWSVPFGYNLFASTLGKNEVGTNA